MDPKTKIEQTLSETIYRSIYYGHQIYSILVSLAETIDPTNTIALDFVKARILTLDHDEIYRKTTIQNYFLDLWSLVVNNTSIETELIDAAIRQ